MFIRQTIIKMIFIYYSPTGDGVTWLCHLGYPFDISKLSTLKSPLYAENPGFRASVEEKDSEDSGF